MPGSNRSNGRVRLAPAIAGALGLWLLSILASCASQPPEQAAQPQASEAAPPVAAAVPEAAVRMALRPGPAVTSWQGWQTLDHGAALAAFRRSCASLGRREDLSGLTRPEDWQPVCDAARNAADPRAFFEAQFASLQVAQGEGLNTGYFEPELAGSRSPSPDYPYPLYKRPPELVEVPLGDFITDMKGRTIRGKVEKGRLVRFADRAAIEDGALAGRGLELAWVADPYEAFFLHVQGSGKLRLPDGSVMRVGYDGQNSHDYVGIGRRLLERGLLEPGQATMEGILAWMRANPAQGAALMRENGSFIFFRELEKDLAGPPGRNGRAGHRRGLGCRRPEIRATRCAAATGRQPAGRRQPAAQPAAQCADGGPGCRRCHQGA